MNEALKPFYSEQILEEACKRYSIDHTSAQLLKANFNLVYACDDKILRLSHSTIRPQKEILMELDWVMFLCNQGLPIAQVIPSNQQNITEQIGDKTHYFTVVCFEKIIGNRVTEEQWTNNHFKKLGKIQGQLHRIGQTYTKRADLHYLHWDEIPEYDSYKHLPADERNLLALHDQLVAEFNTYPKTTELYGLIHYDIHHGNYLMTENEERIFLFDFEMASKSWYINDVATTLYYACNFPTNEDLDKFELRFLQHFWDGYQTEYQLPDSEKEKIPKFLLYRDLMLCGHLKLILKGQILTPGQIKYKNSVSESIDRRRKNLGL